MFSPETIINFIGWNLDASILAINSSDLKNQTCRLQFWTVSNYCWMQKVCYEFSTLFRTCFWDAECVNKFHFLDERGVYRRLELGFEYNFENTVAVVLAGGKYLLCILCGLNFFLFLDKIKVTLFDAAPIPPPMCHSTLQLDHFPSAISLCLSGKRLVVVSSDGLRISTCKFVETINKNKILRNNFRRKN